MNTIPILSGRNSFLRIIAENLDQNGVKFYWYVFNPLYGAMEPALEDQREKFADIVTGLMRYRPELFEVN